MRVTRIGGIDISRNWIILCILESFPSPSVAQLFEGLHTVENWKKRKSQKINEIMYRLEADQAGVDILKELNLDAVIMEPSGLWYSGFWANTCKDLGIEILWVSHQQVKYSRKHYQLKNKDDRSDALAIAALYFDPTCRDKKGNPPLLRNYDHVTLNQVKEFFFQREQLSKLRNAHVNQIRQRLTMEFPEIAEKNFDYLGKKSRINPTLGHIAGLQKNVRVPIVTLGTGITAYTKEHALRIISLENQDQELELKLSGLLALPDFKPYMEVFDKFRYGIILKSLLLFHCYPFDGFLVNGKPDLSPKGKDLSLRKFQAFLGLAYSYEQSGSTSQSKDIMTKTWLGSKIVRNHLYAHALCIICSKKVVAYSEPLKRLKQDWFNDRVDPQTGVVSPSFKSLGKDGLCRLLFLETRLLYRELRQATSRKD